MDKICEDFVEECSANHTTVAVFIKLFNMWSVLDSDQRGQIIDSEIKRGRLEVRK